MRRIAFWPALLSCLAAFSFMTGHSASGQASEARSFVLAASDGYGVQDCLAEGGECGRASPTPGAKRTALGPRPIVSAGPT